jgi:hypothetical protein
MILVARATLCMICKSRMQICILMSIHMLDKTRRFCMRVDLDSGGESSDDAPSTQSVLIS